MQNCNYVYIELLRQVCPYKEPFIDFDFFLLGSFDAMSVDIGTDIDDMKKKYESKHSKVLSVFDRQPIYLYSKNGVNLKASDLSDNIFSTKKENACIPLILTLFQLDKIKLSNKKNSSPEDIIDQFTSIIKGNISSATARFKVFWNLGESDVVVVFRSIYLKEISNLLHVFRVYGVNSETIDIISTASHCAFPKPDSIQKDMNGSEAKVEILKNLNEWLWEPTQSSTHNQLAEHCQYDSSSFITLGNVASCDDPEFSNDKAFDFLFGEWDYMLKFKNLKELKEHMMDTFMCLITSHGKLSRYAPFRVSYTIPLFPVPKIEDKKHNSKKGNNKKDSKQNKELIELSKSMNKIKELISNSDCFPTVRKDGLTKEIDSFNNTLTGLGKFLYRLKIGRFEEDLYVYIQPVFVRLKKITNDYAKSITKYLKKGQVNYADDLIIEYISDTADLTEKLQHLFSIMAVSPHTYMETYGSNMRSLAAADKLLDSYQGIIQFLKDSFPDIIDPNDASRSTGREILIFPHRKTQSHHNLLFFHSSPENRISYISLDFTKMFRLKGTIFMLLHECGHHLGNRSREERFKLFYATLICAVICWASAGDYINNPIEYFVKITNSKDLYSAKDSQMSLLLKGLSQKNKDDIITTYSNRIRKAVLNGVQIMGNGLYKDKDIIKNYINYYIREKSIAPYEEKLWKNFYSEQVLSYLHNEGVPQYFGVDKNETEIQFKERMSTAVKEMIEVNLAEELKKISDDLANEIADKNGNIREALRIKTMYGDTKQIVNDLYDPIEAIIDARWNEGAFQSLFDIFSDIYADLFAISLLDVKYKEYVEIIPEILGMEKIASSTDKRNLLRFYVVAKSAFKSTDLKSFAKSFNTDISKEMMEIWNLFEYYPYVSFLLDYARICSDVLTNEIEALKKNSELFDSLDQLRKMFRDNDKQINGIYHFYQYLMNSRS